MERLTTRDAKGTYFITPIGNALYASELSSATVQVLLDRLAAYEDAEDAGLLVRIDERFALAMMAGARAIEQNPRKYFGTTFVHDAFGDNPKKIKYCDAAKMLCEGAEAALAKEG